ncbi:DNase I-like protein [Dioscorea alata]|uniref:DNase I-like protein n=1 Tax=Dioscorea alata TaxID=55571 RepID=A0ACB7VS63_DIOAL|nr:DNase I-like protein [Dioscorea alata]
MATFLNNLIAFNLIENKSTLDSATPSIWRSVGGNSFDAYCWSPFKGASGGMIIRWSSSILKGNLIHSGNFCLTVEFHKTLGVGNWLCTSVYRPNDRYLKQSFWEEIRTSNGGKDLPWVICGDFNTIFSTFTKQGGHHSSSRP